MDTFTIFCIVGAAILIPAFIYLELSNIKSFEQSFNQDVAFIEAMINVAIMPRDYELIADCIKSLNKDYSAYVSEKKIKEAKCFLKRELKNRMDNLQLLTA